MSDRVEVSSRIPGFYRQTITRRLELLKKVGHLSSEAESYLAGGGRVAVSSVDRMSENVVACHNLPFSVALNFRVNHRDVLVPMAVEEPSIVAAASHAARLVRISGGFVGESAPPVMTSQIQLDEVRDARVAKEKLMGAKQEILRAGDLAIPRMVARGGGCRDLDVRVLSESEGILVVHLYVDVRDAMGANLVDSVAEATAPVIQNIVGGRIGLRILSNLALRRLVRVSARVSRDALGGADVCEGIARASRFAELDPFRAATHNKGIMNGIDAAAVALGQDWRAIEAGAHAFAALGEGYRPLATWKRSEEGVEGFLELPLAVATVGGSTRAHEGVRTAFEIVQVENAQELAVVIAAAGLACNLAALRALAGEGIQRGHMRLHHRKALSNGDTLSAKWSG